MKGGCTDTIKENYDELLDRLPEPTTDYHISSSETMNEIDGGSADLVVTSPPYPMVEMWEEWFGEYDKMHRMIEEVLKECYRALDEGGIACINIGDATRTVDGEFQCYPNHAEILIRAREMGFQTLVPIHWKKPTNKPNSFLGSGFMPTNAYVTLDTEHILVLRKGGRREFGDKLVRHASKYSKEQRDVWFSQTWEIAGETQEGYAVFPREIPYRLIRMFSLLGDTVVDPFTGTGTTLQVARALGRSAVGYEINDELEPKIEESLSKVDSVSMADVLENHVRSERNDNFGVDEFVENTNTLIDVI